MVNLLKVSDKRFWCHDDFKAALIGAFNVIITIYYFRNNNVEE